MEEELNYTLKRGPIIRAAAEGPNAMLAAIMEQLPEDTPVPAGLIIMKSILQEMDGYRPEGITDEQNEGAHAAMREAIENIDRLLAEAGVEVTKMVVEKLVMQANGTKAPMQ